MKALKLSSNDIWTALSHLRFLFEFAYFIRCVSLSMILILRRNHSYSFVRFFYCYTFSPFSILNFSFLLSNEINLIIIFFRMSELHHPLFTAHSRHYFFPSLSLPLMVRGFFTWRTGFWWPQGPFFSSFLFCLLLRMHTSRA